MGHTALAAALRATAGPFATLAVIILAATLAGRLGIFRVLASAPSGPGRITNGFQGDGPGSGRCLAGWLVMPWPGS